MANREKASDGNMAMGIQAYFENVLIIFLIVVTFFVLILVFLYMIYGREEASASTTAAPKTKT